MAANQEYQDRGLFAQKDEGRQDGDMMQNQHLRPNPNPAQKSGLVDKVKEKLPGGQTQTAQYNPQTAQKLPGGQTQTAQYNPQTAQCNPAEKAGMMDKVKEKIPGGHSQNQYETADFNPGEKKGHPQNQYETADCNPGEKKGHPQNQYKTADCNPGEKKGHPQNQYETADCNPGEKKGMGDKIKERLPGGRNKE